ncbi:hypothetical protein ZIOFF_051577 [Zingiber officinale]|uniref:Phosphatidate cytidylyltransferase n=1 Tax=Zingiber officinale TaxID=94328 RepID=A0A8J5FM63_ZINOF|nr:hypothetical protein ZIOFF_051577 [Zingiber officinale]
MNRDSSSTDTSSNYLGRARHRKRSSECYRFCIPSQVSSDSDRANESKLLVNDHNKYKSMLIRTYSSVWMIAGFSFILYMGHLYIWAMIVVIQIFMARELFNLLRRANEERQLPGFRLLNWHFFFTAMLFTYGRFLSRQLVNTMTSDKLLFKLVSVLIKYQMFICYFLYIAVCLHCSKHIRGYILVNVPYSLANALLSESLVLNLTLFNDNLFTIRCYAVQFLMPASLIIINDIAAYFFGFFFGRTPLIKLSPKKTWEGFIGASVTTLFAAFVVNTIPFFAGHMLYLDSHLLSFCHVLLSNILGRFQWLTCPKKDLSTGWLHCDPDPLFKTEYFLVSSWMQRWFPLKEIPYLPVQFHALALGLFASIIAPFGGFFASGFKRAFKLKDFGDSIPGHGGITDRMDCQVSCLKSFSNCYDFCN